MVIPLRPGVGDRPGVAHRSRVAAWLLLVVAGLFLAAASPAYGQASTIVAVTVHGVITPVIADHIRDALDRAEREGHQALLVQLDTPGGLDTSMRDIIQSFLNARVPVIVFVSPQGARAASAGALITQRPDPRPLPRPERSAGGPIGLGGPPPECVDPPPAAARIG